MPSKKSSPRRLYRHCGDPEMLETARVFQQLFADNLATFTAFDSTLDTDYSAAWLADIQVAESAGRNTTSEAILKGHTKATAAAMAEAWDVWTDVAFFVKKAFPKSRAALESFGASAFTKGRSNQLAMLDALRILQPVAAEHADALVAAGFNETGIERIGSALSALETANTAQEGYKREMARLTEERIELLNAVYTRVRHVCTAAQLAYRDDAAMRGQFKEVRKKKQQV